MLCNNLSQPGRGKRKTRNTFNISYVISILLFVREKLIFKTVLDPHFLYLKEINTTTLYITRELCRTEENMDINLTFKVIYN
jgi:hypothetical protein